MVCKSLVLRQQRKSTPERWKINDVIPVTAQLTAWTVSRPWDSLADFLERVRAEIVRRQRSLGLPAEGNVEGKPAPRTNLRDLQGAPALVSSKSCNKYHKSGALKPLL